MTEKEGVEKLLVYQQDLQLEEECLKKIISKLDAQANALKVEQLDILNAIKKSKHMTNQTAINKEVNLKKETVDSQFKELDLTVPTYQSCEEDEDEMEE